MTPSSQIAGSILSDAFLHYPLMKYAFDGYTEEQRANRLRELYTRCSSAAGLYGGIVTTDDKKGALIWLPGRNFPLTLGQEIKSGMGFIPFKLGLKPTLRLVRHDSVPESWIRDNADDKMGYIWCLGVSASERGKGYSRMLIDRSVAQMKEQGMDTFWLKTEDPRNVAIYTALGFKLMHETVVKSSGLKSWVFKK